MSRAKRGAAAIIVAGAALLGFVTNWEGSSLPVYTDIVGVPTVCNGHTGPDVKLGDVWSKERCDAILVKNVTRFGRAVLRCIHVPINQNQYDAFVSLAFNIGESAFCGSTLVRVANAGDLMAACDQILRWTRAGGRVVRGLVLRRKAERDLCMKPMSGESRQPERTAYAPAHFHRGREFEWAMS